MDQNETNGHSEWQDGGYVESAVVPSWVQTDYQWPTSYQTIVGSLPTTLGYSFANLTPGAVSGVNYTNANPGFACYGSYSSNCTLGVPQGEDSGSHPNPAGANDSNKAVYAFDNIPVQGGNADPVFTPVTAQLYAVVPLSSNGDNIVYTSSCSAPPCPAPINRKVLATGASCGSHPLIDVSGPTSAIASGTTGSYTYCEARTAGECQSGSAVGEIYVNCPGVVYESCAGVATHGGTPLGVGNDICVGNIGVSANAIRQFALAPEGGADAPGANTRNIAAATSRLRMVAGFENNRLMPDSSWVLYRSEFLNYQREDMWMAALPCYPTTTVCSGDSTNRGEFIQKTFAVPAFSGANNAVIEFGYQENGLPAGYTKPAFMNCTTRNDPCWANAASIASPPFTDTSPPFYYKSEYFVTGGPTLVPCSGGCTISVPAISQRMLFYRTRYFNGNTLVGQSEVGVWSVP